jgi:hypothetical protein
MYRKAVRFAEMYRKAVQFAEMYERAVLCVEIYGKAVEFAELYGIAVPLNVQGFKAERLLYVPTCFNITNTLFAHALYYVSFFTITGGRFPKQHYQIAVCDERWCSLTQYRLEPWWYGLRHFRIVLQLYNPVSHFSRPMQSCVVACMLGL